MSEGPAYAPFFGVMGATASVAFSGEFYNEEESFWAYQPVQLLLFFIHECPVIIIISPSLTAEFASNQMLCMSLFVGVG